MASFRANVAALIVDERGRLLVCERFKIPGAWQFPQGGVDEGEEVLTSLRREVQEEVGLPPEAYEVELSRGGYRYLYPSKVRRQKRGGSFDGQEQTYFLCRLSQGAPEICLEQEPREFSQARWIWPEEFDLDWLPDFKREVYRQVMDDFFAVKL